MSSSGLPQGAIPIRQKFMGGIDRRIQSLDSRLSHAGMTNWINAKIGVARQS